MSQTAENKPKFPEILPLVEEYLKDCKETGKPMRINLWDTNHMSNEPSQVLADENLHRLAQKYGSPFYVIEAVPAKPANQMVEKYLYGTKEQSAEIQKRLDSYKTTGTKEATIKQILGYAKNDLENGVKNSTHLIFPDPRGEDSSEILKTLSPEEQAVAKKYQTLLMEEVKKNLVKDGENSQNQIINVIAPKVYTALTKEEKTAFASMQKKLQPVVMGNDNLDTSEIDKKITINIESAKKGNDVQIILYGAAHFSKKMDLDEWMQGLSIAIADSTKNDVVKNLFKDTEFSKVHHDLPEYVYYTDKHKLVKMDSDAAKAEFLGITPEQLKIWKLVNEVRDELPKFPVELESWVKSPNIIFQPVVKSPITQSTRQ